MSIKTSNILYGIAIIAVIGVLSGFIGYTFPTQTPTQQVQTNANTTATTSTKTVVPATTIDTQKTDSCGCCAERRARLQRQKQQVGESKQKRQQIASVNAQTSKN